MDFIFVTGKLGQGKTLVSISRIKQRLERGCLVATNCDIFLDKMFHRKTDKPRVMRVPDKPTLHDLEMIGRGRPKSAGYDESKNGLLVLDECGDWFNSRNWQDKSRSGVNTWFRHARKLGWDVYLVCQDISLIDSQARDALAAAIARCKRMDKLSIPFLTTFSKIFLGYPIRPAKLHITRVQDADGLLLDRWMYRGTDLYDAYDTEQLFNADYQHGVFSYLTPWHIYGRYAVPMNKENLMRLTKIYWKRFSRPGIATVAALFSSVMTAAAFSYFIPSPQMAESTPASTEKVEPTPLPTLADKFNDWHYRGSMAINGQYKYFFTDQNGARFSSEARLMSGYRFSELSHCTLEITKGDDFHVLQCKPEIVSN